MISEDTDGNIRYISFPASPDCWYEAEFLDKLRERIGKHPDILLNVFVFSNNEPAENKSTGSERLTTAGVDIARYILTSSRIFIAYAPGDLGDGRAGLFLASDLRYSSSSTDLSYTVSPYMGEISSLKRFPAVNPYLLLSGLKTLSAREMNESGIVDDFCEDRRELDEILTVFKEKTTDSLISIKELNRRGAPLTYRQGNVIEKSSFSLRFAGEESGERLKDI